MLYKQYPMELDSKEVKRIIKAALAEDIGAGDATSHLLVPEAKTARLSFVNREAIVVCGIEIAAAVFKHLDATLQTQMHVKDGNRADAGTRLLDVHGPARAVLAAERTALNLLQRMSAVATLTARYVQAVRGTKAVILDTRKTMPGLREIDKYAVRMGGGRNHRMRLDDAILIKDNHIALCGGVAQALTLALAGNKNGLPVEIECDTLAHVEEALAAGTKAILLDNMNLNDMREAVRLAQGRATLEASGNVSLETVRIIAETGVDFISVGKLTHSAPSVDIGLDVAIAS